MPRKKKNPHRAQDNTFRTEPIPHRRAGTRPLPIDTGFTGFRTGIKRSEVILVARENAKTSHRRLSAIKTRTNEVEGEWCPCRRWIQQFSSRRAASEESNSRKPAQKRQTADQRPGTGCVVVVCFTAGRKCTLEKFYAVLLRASQLDWPKAIKNIMFPVYYVSRHGTRLQP